jgi:hypothetical protein
MAGVICFSEFIKFLSKLHLNGQPNVIKQDPGARFKSSSDDFLPWLRFLRFSSVYPGKFQDST